MDRFDALSAFVAVADQRGFAAAARKLGMSPPAVTRAVAALERHLGVTLFHRSTRAVSLTDEGAAFLDRARRIMSELREAEQIVMGGRSAPRGQLYVTAPVMFGRLHVLPAIGALLAAHDGLSARMMLIDRNVRIVEEGIDVAVRIGPLADSALRVMSIGSVRQTIVASPAYLAAHGVPATPADLAGHRCIVGSGIRIGAAWRFGGKAESTVEVAPRLTVNTIDGTIAAAEAGVGVANVLSYQAAEAVAAGRLVRLLEDHAPPPVPVSLLYDAGRAAMPAVRLFLEAMRERARQGSWD
ncbi:MULTISPECIES: LysR family transcriptional regulator [Sphingobium]|jgi:DNA-binding transcriptional LysR family regulator|uniref:Transcriptional regulator, LysR family n=1 Tax=Sphingobium fuliginis (strain ATCC 27551) TaxID=336203 RepID=A0A292ZMJ7_SPHSA|nr:MULTISPECIES: LysR family transcriptional regulator [Sphingobium]PNP99662.1 LysR family transcriptional regulator [Sphingobium sp. SA916]UXC93364.1 LysR family transcriptional regulator [Sphingobium sp. RSMS]GAY24091.1 transcriptional regulator, LysR family [Sphingobium fuliginis]